MAMLIVAGVIAVFVTLGLYGNWLEKHPEHTPAGRDAAMRRRHEDEIASQRRAHELAMVRAHYDGQMAVNRTKMGAGAASVYQVTPAGLVVSPTRANTEFGDLNTVGECAVCRR
ncbi:hypothetical protein ASG12_11835 [Williamsia sp. Leaf354]|jgi:hypothetical protein|uniref:hypothetical protein n=1 Tax=Williamsia sp. Leaf354 TaxID=1736349 RepID=UPI0006F78AA3|nr:hypothetical protein [Williamsia sp. Leaf354]KQR97768.1 hypothetical protein ASG12_11835 [Williamsia sp. Leaf354]